MKRFSEVIASTDCKSNLDSHTDGGPPEEGKDDKGFHCSQVREFVQSGDPGPGREVWVELYRRVEGAGVHSKSKGQELRWGRRGMISCSHVQGWLS